MTIDIQMRKMFSLESASVSIGLELSKIIEMAINGTVSLYLKVPDKFATWIVELSGNQVVSSKLLPIEFVALSEQDCRSILSNERYQKARFDTGLFVDESGELQQTRLEFGSIMRDFAISGDLVRRVALKLDSQYEIVVCPVGIKQFDFNDAVEIPLLVLDIRININDLNKLAKLEGMSEAALDKIDGIEFHEKWSKMLRLMHIVICIFSNDKTIRDQIVNSDEELIRECLSGESDKMSKKMMELNNVEPMKKYLLSTAVKICLPKPSDIPNAQSEQNNIERVFSKEFRDLVEVSKKYWKDCDYDKPETIPNENLIIHVFTQKGYSETFSKHAAMLIRPTDAPRSRQKYIPQVLNKTTKNSPSTK